MRATALLGLCAVLPLAGPPPATAQMRSIEEQRGGAWLYRAGSAGERAACVLETEMLNGAAAGGHIRFAILSRPFDFHMSVRDPRWRIPAGTRGTVRLAVEGPARLASTQRAQQAGPDRVTVDLATNPDGAARILNALRNGRQLAATMPDGQVIGAGLGGTAPLVQRFLDCFRRRIQGQGSASPRPPPRSGRQAVSGPEAPPAAGMVTPALPDRPDQRDPFSGAAATRR